MKTILYTTSLASSLLATLVTFVISSVLFSTSFAAINSEENSNLRAADASSTLQDFQLHCNEKFCDSSYSRQVLYNRAEGINVLDTETVKKIEGKAFDQAQICGDTILEGDYIADGKTQVSSVIGLYKNEELVGYHIEYFEKAWFVQDCDPGASLKRINDCPTGVIVESSFITGDMSHVEIDQNHPAVFR